MKYVIQTTKITLRPGWFILNRGFLTKLLGRALAVDKLNDIDPHYINNNDYNIIKVTEQELFKAKLTGI